MRVCVVVPMYNEERIARLSVETILQYTLNMPPVVTLLVVNDGSQDATKQIVQEIANRHQEVELSIINHSVNRGYGAALKTGIGYAADHSYDYVLFMDSDLTNHPRYLKDFYDKMGEGWDYIKATRYAIGGSIEGVPWIRRVISIAGNSIARNLYRLPLTDITNGFRAVKVDILKRMMLKENDFVIIMEELFHAKRITRSFCEIPYALTSRSEEQGMTHFPYTLDTCLRYLKYAVKSFRQIRHKG